MNKYENYFSNEIKHECNKNIDESNFFETESIESENLFSKIKLASNELFERTVELASEECSSLECDLQYEESNNPETETSDEKENFNNLLKFFDIDLEIKNDISKDLFSTDVIEFGDNLINQNKDISFKLKKLSQKMNALNLGSFTDEDLLKIDTKIDSIKDHINKEITDNGYSIGNLSEIYKSNISNMKKELVDYVNEHIHGALLIKDVEGVLDNVDTYNELLHFMHRYVETDDDMYEKLPLWGRDNLNMHHRAYGRKNALAESLFYYLSENISKNRVDIYGNMVGGNDDFMMFSNGDNIKLLIRDSGHSTFIDMITDSDKVLVNYNIPKTINVEAINGLPGVRKINHNDKFATGQFEVDKSNLNNYISDFITKIPTDEMI